MQESFSETELEQLLQGDQRATERWVSVYGSGLYTFVFYRVGMQADIAADVVQDTFASAWRKLQDFDSQRGSMSAWLATLSRNKIKKALRTRHRNVSLIQISQETDGGLLRMYGLVATEPLPQEVLQSRETAHIVRLTLSTIPDDYKQALTEHYYNRTPLKDIAADIGISAGAAKAMLHRARQAFKVAFLRLSKPSYDEKGMGMSDE